MKITSFRATNFKGIEDCTINLDPPGRIVTLVGLNESGKTTILEALASFLGQDEDLPAVIGSYRTTKQLKFLIPKHRKANFTGEVALYATLVIEDADREALYSHYASNGYVLDKDALPSSFELKRYYSFESSESKQTGNLWSGISFSLKKEGEQDFVEYWDTPENRPGWLIGVTFIGANLIPRICYFPTFLFNIPEKITLASKTDSAIDTYYRRLLQNVLDARNDGLSLQAHVIDRLKKFEVTNAETKMVSWKAADQDTKENVSAVFARLSSELNRTIIKSWDEIFGAVPSGKKIEIDWDFDAATRNAPYCQFKVWDGEDSFSLYERSLGFRWFFCFLLLTQFNSFKNERRRTYFLLDEPASNLHSSAQMSLLRSFPKIAGKHNAVVYSTHSQYMIEPLWLEGAYIVANDALNYDKDRPDFDYSNVGSTQITATKYREFVAHHPNTPTYFQPVLDRLGYRVSPLIGQKPALIMEGKQDFYATKYFLSGLQSKIDIVPGAGAGNMAALISLFVGWGRKFLILLDDDKEGRSQKARYQSELLLNGAEVATFGDVHPSLKGMELEGLFSLELKNKVSQERALNKRPSKKDFALFFQERLATGNHLDLDDIDDETKQAFKYVSGFVATKLS